MRILFMLSPLALVWSVNLTACTRSVRSRRGCFLPVFIECETEIETLCSDVAIGGGRLLACLDENEEDVGQSCKTAISETVR